MQMAVSARLAHGGVMLAALALLLWRMPTAEQGFFFSFLSLGGFLLVGGLGHRRPSSVAQSLPGVT